MLQASVELPLAVRSRASLLESLASRITHTGGRTSIVSGVVEVARMVAETRRNARLVVIMLSDGVSQVREEF